MNVFDVTLCGAGYCALVAGMGVDDESAKQEHCQHDGWQNAFDQKIIYSPAQWFALLKVKVTKPGSGTRYVPGVLR